MSELVIGVACVYAWLLVSFVLQALQRDQMRHVMPNAVVGLGTWCAATVGAYLLLLTEYSVAGGVFLVVGLSGWLGWIVSPGGVRSFYAPIGLMTGHWVKGWTPPPVPPENCACWTRESSVLAGIVICVVLLALMGYSLVMVIAN